MEDECGGNECFLGKCRVGWYHAKVGPEDFELYWPRRFQVAENDISFDSGIIFCNRARGQVPS
jgi:hypothetical protein